MSGKMSLINVTIQHGQTAEEARRRLETTVLKRTIQETFQKKLSYQCNAPGGGSPTKEFRHDEQSPA
jgi:hypothetical protein